MDLQLHQVQMRILKHLLLNKEASFSAISNIIGIKSDHFSYHLTCLQKSKYVEKSGDNYKLTVSGKEFANRMDTERNIIEKQAKLGALLMIEKIEDGKTYFLIQKRLKEPYYGFSGFITGKISWGESIHDTAKRELQEETGLSAKLEHRFIIHEHVYHKEDGRLLEDKFFFIFKGTNPEGELKNFEGGENKWILKSDFLKQDKVYYDEFEILDLVEKNFKGLIEREYFIEEF